MNFTLWLFVTGVVLIVAAEDTPALRELKNGNLQFSAKTYKELVNKNAGKNFLVCPLSVSVVLALVEAGAAGKTAQQLISGLSLPETEEKIHEAIKTIAPSLNVKDEYTLSSANKVYIKEGFKIRPEFKAIATDVFNAEVKEIDFAKSDAASLEINKWVEDKTHDKIKNLISKDDLDDSTRAVLINALYFYGAWAKPFYVENTQEKPFKLNTKEEATVKIMEQTNRFGYYEDTNLKAKFLELEYDRSPISIVFVLPNEIDGLAALESNIEKVLDFPEFKYEKVHVQIPHVNIEHKIDFIPILQEFGVKDAFTSAANFSRLTENYDNLSVSKIIQKTFIAVEEKGTTAAAATAVILTKTASFDGGADRPPREFNANHPFIFVVKSQNGVIFVGRYVNPSDK